MTVELMRKRPLEDVNEDDLSDNIHDKDPEDFDIDQMLSQHDFKSSKQRNKIQKRVLLKMTQASVQTTQVQNEDLPVAGVIKRVTLKNFMCHQNFELNFGPRLNFIIGHNGSGKSAILTAISVCLGAKATETNRGSSLKDLIKEGTNISQISVVLNNEGVNGFDQGKFGNEIIVERVLKRDSATAPYVLKSENGKIVSKKKSDLDALLDYFNIAVNNPMSFLSQDAARSFLTASTDDQKYKYFMKGTMMEEIFENFKKTKEQIEKVDLKLLRMKDDVSFLRDEAKEARALHERLLSSNELRIRQRILTGKYFWMESDKAQETIESVKETQEEYRASIKLIEEKLQELDFKIDEIDDKRSKIHEKKDAIQEDLAQSMENLKSKKEQANVSIGKAEAHSQQVSNIQRKIKELDSKIQVLQKNVSVEEQKLRERNGGSKDLLLDQLESLNSKQGGLNSQISSLKDQISDIDSKNRETFDDLTREADNKREDIRSLEQHIKRLKGKAINPLDAFSPNVRNVVKDISKSSFDFKPIGPLGKEIRIKEEFAKWIPLINSCLQNHVNTFVVRTLRDQRTLQRIMRDNNCTSSILIRKPENFDYSHGMPSREFTTILDALDFLIPEVEFIIVDLAKVETNVLESDRTTAQRILESRAHNVLQVCSLVNSSSGSRMSMNKHGGFRSDPQYYDTRYLPKITLNSGSQDVSFFEQQFNDLKAQFNDLQVQKAEQNKASQREKSVIYSQVKQLEAELRRSKTASYEIRKKLEDDADDGRLEVLKEELENHIQEKQVNERAIPDVQEQIAQYREFGAAAVQEYNEAKAQHEGINKILQQYRQFEQENDADREFNLAKKEHLFKGKTKREQELETLTGNLPAWELKVDENNTEALRHCTREEAESIQLRTIESVKNEIRRVAAEVEKSNRALGKSPEDIVNEDAIARSKYQESLTQFTEARDGRHLLHRSLHERVRSYREHRNSTFVEADLDFKGSLQFRNFSGNLDFDPDKGRLKMLVSTKNDAKPRHVDSLSGGEKSFSQIALLLATWKPMRSRIKGLDEFDVFMDQINRKIGMRLMLSKLSAEANSQTIFITPQDIGQIADLDEKLVKIHRVKDPRPTQTT